MLTCKAKCKAREVCEQNHVIQRNGRSHQVMEELEMDSWSVCYDPGGPGKRVQNRRYQQVLLTEVRKCT